MQQTQVIEATLYDYSMKLSNLLAEGWQVSDRTDCFPVFDGVAFRAILVKAEKSESVVKLEAAIEEKQQATETPVKASGRGRSKAGAA